MKHFIRPFLILCMFFVSIFFFYAAYKESQPFLEAEEKNTIIKNAVISDSSSDTPLDRIIDFEVLKAINPDIIGWLYIPQINLDQPILKGEQYLSLDYKGAYDMVGSIFTYDSVNEHLTDPHLILFGHNMNSGQMFGNLDQFQTQAFEETSQTIYLYTPERTKELLVTSVFECQITDDFFQEDSFTQSSSQTISLVTCTASGSSNARLVVNCQVNKVKIIL